MSKSMLQQTLSRGYQSAATVLQQSQYYSGDVPCLVSACSHCVKQRCHYMQVRPLKGRHKLVRRQQGDSKQIYPYPRLGGDGSSCFINTNSLNHMFNNPNDVQINHHLNHPVFNRCLMQKTCMFPSTVHYYLLCTTAILLKRN